MLPIRHVIESACTSVDDDPATQIFNDYDMLCRAVLLASRQTIKSENPFANLFPGDHYRILSGLMLELQPKVIVDIGTHSGVGTRIFLDYAPGAVVHTFDVTPWDRFDTTYLTSKDFVENGGRLTQYIADLSDPRIFPSFIELLDIADFIMCDGPKDGNFENKFYTLLSTLNLAKKPRWLFLDDIRFLSEINSWRSIQSPKIDITSFGHFSGSGLVDISHGFVFDP
jgi:hypothetical protein